MTVEQQQIVQTFENNIEEETLKCLDCLYEIDKIGINGHVPLPATSASGEPVLHGANLTIFALRNYYLKRIALVRLMSRETYDKWVPEFYKSESSRVGI
jgi:hypothetical protein